MNTYSIPSNPWPRDGDGNLSPGNSYSHGEGDEDVEMRMRSLSLRTSSPISPAVDPGPFFYSRKTFCPEDVLTLTHLQPSSIIPKIRLIFHRPDIDLSLITRRQVKQLLVSDYAVCDQWLLANKRLSSGLISQVWLEELQKRQEEAEAVMEVLESALAGISLMREVDIDSDTLASNIDSTTMVDDLESTLSGLKLSG